MEWSVFSKFPEVGLIFLTVLGNLLNCIKSTFSARFIFFYLVYLQHHKDQMEVVIWVKDHFKKGSCQKINIIAFFIKKVPLNSQAFLGI